MSDYSKRTEKLRTVNQSVKPEELIAYSIVDWGQEKPFRESIADISLMLIPVPIG